MQAAPSDPSKETSTPRPLVLQRPLVAFDLETTGLDATNDRIVEISCIKMRPTGERDVYTQRLNPGMPISAEATAVHGISDAMVADAPRFEDISADLLAFLAGADLTGFNIEHFDLPMLTREFQRAGVVYPHEPTKIIDSFRIYIQKEPRDLAAAYRFYCGKTLVGAHSAEADAMAAAEIVMAQVQHYADLPTDVPGLHAASHPQKPDWLDPDGRIVWRNNEACLGFGKHRNKPLREMVAKSPEYLRWMASADFSPAVVTLCKNALQGEFPKPASVQPEKKPFSAPLAATPIQGVLPL